MTAHLHSVVVVDLGLVVTADVAILAVLVTTRSVLPCFALRHEKSMVCVVDSVAHLDDLVEVPIQLLRPVEMMLVAPTSQELLVLLARHIPHPPKLCGASR